jgi:acyl carrier protein
MNSTLIDEKLRQIVIEVLKIPAADYSEDLTAGDHPQWDSIGHVNLLMAVEHGFEISFDVTDAIDIESVADLQDMVRKYLAQKLGSGAA